MIRNQTAADEYREVAGRFTALVEAVPDDATWNRQSPVAEWTARDVVRHLVEWFPGFLAGGTGIDLPQGPGVDDDPVAAWRTMSDGVQTLLDDPEEAWAMGQRGREAVGARYSWATEGDRLIDAYHRHVGAPGGRATAAEA